LGKGKNMREIAPKRSEDLPGERFHAVVPADEQALEAIAAAFMHDPANAAAIADEKLWDATIGDGLDGIRA
jgi:hypothetical protein